MAGGRWKDSQCGNRVVRPDFAIRLIHKREIGLTVEIDQRPFAANLVESSPSLCHSAQFRQANRNSCAASLILTVDERGGKHQSALIPHCRGIAPALAGCIVRRGSGIPYSIPQRRSIPPPHRPENATSSSTVRRGTATTNRKTPSARATGRVSTSRGTALPRVMVGLPHVMAP